MDYKEFLELVKSLQQTQVIASNPELRLKVYGDFEGIFNFLDTQEWKEENLVERHQYDERAVFQNVAEAYFRLGFIENIFFQYSKLVYELWYKKAIEFQKRLKKRIHKGTQLHQVATIYEFLGSFDKSWDYYLAAFIEDIVDGREYSQSQAYRTFRRFGLPQSNLSNVVGKAKELKGEETYNPLQIAELLIKTFIMPSYGDNESIDLLKLDQARTLWNQLEKKDKRKNG